MRKSAGTSSNSPTDKYRMSFVDPAFTLVKQGQPEQHVTHILAKVSPQPIIEFTLGNSKDSGEVLMADNAMMVKENPMMA